MPYDKHLAARIALQLRRKHVAFEEKKMFGGICFMVDDKMCMGVVGDKIMARTNPNEMVALLELEGAAPMDFTGRSMKGFIFVGDTGYDTENELDFWVDKCLEYNPLAKSSKRKKT